MTLIWAEGFTGDKALAVQRLAAEREGELHAVQIGVVGRYAISIQWSDGHDTGIYSYETLRQLCPCEICQPARDGIDA